MPSVYDAELRAAHAALTPAITAALSHLGTTQPSWARAAFPAKMALSLTPKGRGKMVAVKVTRSAHDQCALIAARPPLEQAFARFARAIQAVPALSHPRFAPRMPVLRTDTFPRAVRIDIARKSLVVRTWEEQITALLAIAARLAPLPSSADAPLWLVGANAIAAPSAAQAVLVHHVLTKPYSPLPTQPSKLPRVARLVEAPTLCKDAWALDQRS